MAITREGMLLRELEETRNTLQRQRLLKKIWHLKRAREPEEADETALPVMAGLPAGGDPQSLNAVSVL
jgi:hypothetical protein